MTRTSSLKVYAATWALAGAIGFSLIPASAYPQEGVDMGCSPTVANPNCQGGTESGGGDYSNGGDYDSGDNRLRNGHLDEGLFSTLPEPGYTWVDPTSEDDLRVFWSPGTEHRKHPHVLASDTERYWLPEDGYNWVGEPPPEGPWRVRWTPGITLPGNPNVVASEDEGRFVPKDGFAWVNPSVPRDYQVFWQPGVLSGEFAHVVTGNDENTFFAADGYMWVDNPPVPGDLRVRWVPYSASTTYPHVRASETEGEFLPDDGYQWLGDPAAGDLSVYWLAGIAATGNPNLLTANPEGMWAPAEGYQWIDDTNLLVGPIPPNAPPPSSLAAVETAPLQNGFIGGTSWQLAIAMPEHATRAERRRAQELLREQSELAGADYESAIDTRRYDFALGIAASTSIFEDLSTRVLLDQFSQGRATPLLQAEYELLRGKRLDELGCHSNGAMICLAALQNGDLTARHVVLYGPQITVESLRMWDNMVREGRVKTIQMLVNQNDPVPPLSLLASSAAGPFGTIVPGIAALPLLLSPSAMQNAVQYVAPSIHVATFDCSSSIVSLQCHDMALYRAARGCVMTPQSSGLAVPGTALPGRAPLIEPPPPC